MLSAKPGDILVTERIYEAFNNIGYEIRKPNLMSNSVYSSSDFGVPQERKRVIIFGVKRDGNIQIEDLYKALDSSKSKESKKTVKDAIGYLPKFKPLEFPYKRGRNNVSHEPIDDISIPFHIPRYHNKRDIIVFFDWLSKKMNDFPHDKKIAYYKEVTGQDTNHNKYRNLEWEKPSPTIVAHLHKDGLMFIHPDINQLRSITIREAALLQSFPTDFEFLGSNADCFKMIGNAVPVLFAKAIANSLYMVMEKNNEKI
jgi:DNA (cytosine-5)-methyltransferase 1